VHAINKALGFIEKHLGDDIVLEDIAKASNISVFYLSHVFASVTGLPVMQYVRNRRLTEAAKRLKRGTPNILNIALDYGYDSHGAFTRAFVARFGVSPKDCRDNDHSIESMFVEPYIWRKAMSWEINTPRIEVDLDMDLVGLCASCAYSTRHKDVGDLYSRLLSRHGELPNRKGDESIVYIHNVSAENFDAFVGAPVSSTEQVPKDLMHQKLKGSRFAVFSYEGEAGQLESMIMSIVMTWLPQSKFSPVDGSHIQRIMTPNPAKSSWIKAELWFPVHAEDKKTNIRTQTPRFESELSLNLVGIGASFTQATRYESGSVMQRVQQNLDSIPNREGREICNVVDNIKGDNFDFFTGVPVSSVGQLPVGYQHRMVSGQKYAVFTAENWRDIEAVVMMAFTTWLPQSKLKPVNPGCHIQRVSNVEDPSDPGSIKAEIWILVDLPITKRRAT
jgi:AraC family transcriptional regulator